MSVRFKRLGDSGVVRLGSLLSHISDTRIEFPIQVFANVFPDDVLCMQRLVRLEEGKVGQQVILAQQLGKLVQHVAVTQEVPLSRLHPESPPQVISLLPQNIEAAARFGSGQ